MSNPNPNLRDREVYSREVRQEPVVVRDSDSSGVVVGVALALLAALGIGAFLLANQRPATQAPARNTVIEKTREVVPVPQPKAPDVNITVPSPAPPRVPDINVNVPSPEVPKINLPSPEVPQPSPSVAPEPQTTSPANP